MSVDLHFSPDAVRGSMKAMGNEMPIETKLDGPVLMDGAPLQIAVSTLPLSRGYKTALKSFDLPSAKVAGMALEVDGEEQVGVLAGTFETYRVAVRRVDSPGASTLWIERTEPRRVVK